MTCSPWPPPPVDARYRFRLFTPDDLSELRAMFGHPDFFRTMSPDGHPWSDDDLRAAIARWQRDAETHGFTKWRVEASDGEFIGRAGISPLPDNPTEAELGYGIVRPAWGRGHATALATIVRDWTWANTSLPYLLGLTVPGNAASQRVLAKIGMVSIAPRLYHGQMLPFFRVDRP